MKNLLVKIFICFAYQGHLTEKDDYFIEFLIKNICYYGHSSVSYSLFIVQYSYLCYLEYLLVWNTYLICKCENIYIFKSENRCTNSWPQSV
jgi:hypothetical protein